jgi:anti-anti-sigma regulatory factor
MLRITSRIQPDCCALKVEGWLTGPWVGELDASWQTALDRCDARRICVDLSAVYYVDEAGRELLTRMYRAGAAFATKGCTMSELVRELAEVDALARRN